MSDIEKWEANRLQFCEDIKRGAERKLKRELTEEETTAIFFPMSLSFMELMDMGFFYAKDVEEAEKEMANTVEFWKKEKDRQSNNER